MAEIEIERRPRRRVWTWVALLLVLLAVGVGVWLVYSGGLESGRAAPAAETTTIQEPLTEPVEPLESPATAAPQEPVPGADTVPPAGAPQPQP
ncbi:MAG TPA: hypothetical protein VMM12_05630 [Longimicrobiales bacterium]|nr:hypothetical protein [Longimicrobiales bacterium]